MRKPTCSGYTHRTGLVCRREHSPRTSTEGDRMEQKALAMNDSLADAHALLGVLYTSSNGTTKRSSKRRRRWRSIPIRASRIITCVFVLRWSGKPTESIPVFKKSIRLEPLAPDIYNDKWRWPISTNGTDCEEAIAACEKGLKRAAGRHDVTLHGDHRLGDCGKGRRRGKKDPKSSGSAQIFNLESVMRERPL